MSRFSNFSIRSLLSLKIRPVKFFKKAKNSENNRFLSPFYLLKHQFFRYYPIFMVFSKNISQIFMLQIRKTTPFETDYDKQHTTFSYLMRFSSSKHSQKFAYCHFLAPQKIRMETSIKQLISLIYQFFLKSFNFEFFFLDFHFFFRQGVLYFKVLFCYCFFCFKFPF